MKAYWIRQASEWVNLASQHAQFADLPGVEARISECIYHLDYALREALR